MSIFPYTRRVVQLLNYLKKIPLRRNGRAFPKFNIYFSSIGLIGQINSITIRQNMLEPYEFL